MFVYVYVCCILVWWDAWDMRPWSHLVVDSPTKTSTLEKLKTISYPPARTKKLIYLCFSLYIFKKKKKHETQN